MSRLNVMHYIGNFWWQLFALFEQILWAKICIWANFRLWAAQFQIKAFNQCSFSAMVNFDACFIVLFIRYLKRVTERFPQLISFHFNYTAVLLTTTIAPVEKFDLTDGGRLSVDASLSFSIWIGHVAVMPIVDVTALEGFVNCCLGMTMVSWVRQHASHSNGYKLHEGVGVQS